MAKGPSDFEEWDPKTGTVKPKTGGGIRPGGNIKSGSPAVPISPGGYMKGKSTPEYKKGGKVRAKAPAKR